MNPPLRTKEDADSIIKAIADGTIDAIITDHAPHIEAQKDVEFNLAPFGIIGLETALGLVLTSLYHHSGIIDIEKIVERMSYAPARILGIENNGVQKGAEANLTIIDVDKHWVVKKEEILSKSKNSPYIGKTLQGKAVGVIVNGEWRYKIED